MRFLEWTIPFTLTKKGGTPKISIQRRTIEWHCRTLESQRSRVFPSQGCVHLFLVPGLFCYPCMWPIHRQRANNLLQPTIARAVWSNFMVQ